MLVILPEWEQAVYNFPSDCCKPKAKTPTSGGTGSRPGASVATRAVGGLDAQTSSRPGWERGPGSPCPSRSLGEPRLPYLQIAEQIISEHI